MKSLEEQKNLYNFFNKISACINSGINGSEIFREMSRLVGEFNINLAELKSGTGGEIEDLREHHIYKFDIENKENSILITHASVVEKLPNKELIKCNTSDWTLISNKGIFSLREPIPFYYDDSLDEIYFITKFDLGQGSSVIIRKYYELK